MNPILKENRYLVVKNFIPKMQAKKLADSFKQFSRENKLIGDAQVTNSQSYYNYIPFFELLCNKTQHVSKLLGENVLPTYTYSRVYTKGAELGRHTDRDSCEISLTVNLSQKETWPIFFQTPDKKEASVVLTPGDAAMYLGCDVEHWRFPYQGEELTQVFLHYVRSNGERKHFAFDFKNNFLFNQKENTVVDAQMNSYVVYLEDIVPENLCDAILAEYTSSDEWVQSTVGLAGNEAPEIRGAKTIPLSITPTLEKNLEVRKDLDKQLFKCASDAIKFYSGKFSECVISFDSGYELLKYEQGFGYSRHTDDFLENHRVVSCSFALNDNYVGGEFNLFNQGLSFKQKKGSALMFPSNFMFPHEVAKVSSGTRYSIVTWFR